MISRIVLYGFGKAVEWAFAGSRPTQKDKGRARRYRRRHHLAVEMLDWDAESLDKEAADGRQEP